MSTYRTTPAGSDSDRHLMRALAALREAAECLDEAAAAEEHPSVRVASALSHVSAARTALRPHGLGEDTRATEQDAA